MYKKKNPPASQLIRFCKSEHRGEKMVFELSDYIRAKSNYKGESVKIGCT